MRSSQGGLKCHIISHAVLLRMLEMEYHFRCVTHRITEIGYHPRSFLPWRGVKLSHILDPRGDGNKIPYHMHIPKRIWKGDTNADSVCMDGARMRYNPICMPMGVGWVKRANGIPSMMRTPAGGRGLTGHHSRLGQP